MMSQSAMSTPAIASTSMPPARPVSLPRMARQSAAASNGFRPTRTGFRMVSTAAA